MRKTKQNRAKPSQFPQKIRHFSSKMMFYRQFSLKIISKIFEITSFLIIAIKDATQEI